MTLYTRLVPGKVDGKQEREMKRKTLVKGGTNVN